jgi:hypothetical protein
LCNTVNSATSPAKSGGNVNTNQSITLGETGLLDILLTASRESGPPIWSRSMAVSVEGMD